jgi:hypothetical protein
VKKIVFVGGGAPKGNANIVPNDYWVTMMLPFIEQNVFCGKINVTHNRGPDAPRNVDQHENRNQNKKAKEDVVALATVAVAKNKVKNFTQQEKESHGLIDANHTQKAPAPPLAKRRKK